MLSFLKEHSDANQQEQVNEKTGDKAETQECSTMATREAHVKKTTRLLAVVFGIGIFCLWFMIAKSGPQAASADTNAAEETEMQLAIAKIIGTKSELNNGTIELMQKFGELSNVKQLKLNDLIKNPFETEMSADDAAAINGVVGQAQGNSPYSKKLQLLGIMYPGDDEGKQCCMINDRLLYEGDTIEDFKVWQIKNKSVTLISETAEKIIVTLNLENESVN